MLYFRFFAEHSVLQPASAGAEFRAAVAAERTEFGATPLFSVDELREVGVRLAMICLTGEMGCPSALTAKTWGFQDVLFRGNPLKLSQPFGSYVMENILFKISFPAEFHAQTAVECALALHAQVKDRIDQIERIEIETQEAGCRIIDKTGPMNNNADRDHCIQYMVAVCP